jgi:hypothetical protein
LVLKQQAIIAVGMDGHLLYSFEGKMTQPTITRRVHSKKDFSWQLWEQQQSVFLQCTQSLVLTQEAIIAIGTDGSRCTRLKEKRHSRQNATRQSCLQKWTFLGKFGSKNDQSFCNVHNVMIEKAFLVLQESWWELPW